MSFKVRKPFSHNALRTCDHTGHKLAQFACKFGIDKYPRVEYTENAG